MTTDPRWTISARHRHTAGPLRSSPRAIAAVVAIMTVAAATIALLDLGIEAGLAMTGSALVAYSILAMSFDWPRMRWADVAGILRVVLRFVYALIALVLAFIVGVIEALLG